MYGEEIVWEKLEVLTAEPVVAGWSVKMQGAKILSHYICTIRPPNLGSRIAVPD